MYNFNNLTNYLDSLVSNGYTSSGDCVIFHHGKEVYRHKTGYKNIDTKEKIIGDETYFIYSCSKPITCATALHAYEEGYFLLTDPVGKFLPEFYDCKVRKIMPDGSEELVPLTKPIRIQNLFSMSAGLTYDIENPVIKEVIKKYEGNPSTREVIRAIAKMPLIFEPGANFEYSLCHDVLACLVEVAVGMPFYEYAKKVIFDPLEMKETSYRANEHLLNKLNGLYLRSWEDGTLNLLPKNNHFVFGNNYDSGGAGLITTISDYAKFAAAMANFGLGLNGNRILSKSTINLMRTNILSGQAFETFNSWDTNAEYGYGFGVRTKIGVGWGGSLTSIGEFGWDGAAGSLVSIDPEREIALVYFQHTLNPIISIMHPRIKMFTVLGIEE